MDRDFLQCERALGHAVSMYDVQWFDDMISGQPFCPDRKQKPQQIIIVQCMQQEPKYEIRSVLTGYTVSFSLSIKFAS